MLPSLIQRSLRHQSVHSTLSSSRLRTGPTDIYDESHVITPVGITLLGKTCLSAPLSDGIPVSTIRTGSRHDHVCTGSVVGVHHLSLLHVDVTDDCETGVLIVPTMPTQHQCDCTKIPMHTQRRDPHRAPNSDWCLHHRRRDVYMVLPCRFVM